MSKLHDAVFVIPAERGTRVIRLRKAVDTNNLFWEGGSEAFSRAVIAWHHHSFEIVGERRLVTSPVTVDGVMDQLEYEDGLIFFMPDGSVEFLGDVWSNFEALTEQVSLMRGPCGQVFADL